MEEENPFQGLGRRLQEAWDELRTRGAQGLLGLLPFGRKPEVPAWERLAKKTLAQVKAENDFFVHAAIYGAGCLFLATANLVTTFFDATEGFPGRIWSVMAIGGWGIGVVMHGVDALVTKRQKFEDDAQHLRRLVAEPQPSVVPAESDLGAMKDRVIRTAEEARGTLGTHGAAAAELVSRGEVKALTTMAWIELAEKQLSGQEAERSLRRDVARRVASSSAPAERSTLVDLMSGLDRREQLRGALAREVAERRERLSSFLLALEGARLARPEALGAVTAPLGERVALLEAATGAAPRVDSGIPVTERHERLEEELRLARELQRSILPERAPAVRSLEVASVYRPCGDVGGDFYDFYQPAESQLLVCLGDASGHGIDSSMVSSMAKGALYLQVAAGRDLSGTLAEINRMMCDTLGRRRLMTLALLCLDAHEGTLSWVNAGQVYPMLLRKGRVRELELPGYPLGVRRNVGYAMQRERLEPGDLLVLFTDGLVEALSASGDIYGWERLRSRLEGRGDLEPGEAVESLAADLTAHLGGGPPQDDVTLVAVSYRP